MYYLLENWILGLNFCENLLKRQQLIEFSRYNNECILSVHSSLIFYCLAWVLGVAGKLCFSSWQRNSVWYYYVEGNLETLDNVSSLDIHRGINRELSLVWIIYNKLHFEIWSLFQWWRWSTFPTSGYQDWPKSLNNPW